MWMIQFGLEVLDQFQFIGTELTLISDVSKWCHKVSIKILSGMPYPEGWFIKGVETTFQLAVFSNAGLFPLQRRMDGGSNVPP